MEMTMMVMKNPLLLGMKIKMKMKLFVMVEMVTINVMIILIIEVRETVPLQTSDMGKKDIISPSTLIFAPIRG